MPRLVVALAALAPGAFLRLYDLTVRPFHHDEGVNGWFFVRLWTDGDYRYDPTNYHGPTLYFLSLAAAWLAGGPSDAVLRGVAVASSVATVALLAWLRPLGRSGAGAAALLGAVSPAAVYFGRDYIHESFFVLCFLAIVVFGERFAATGRTWAAIGAGAAAGLFLATKETAFPLLGVLGLALLVAMPRGPLGRLGLLARWRGIAVGVAVCALVTAAMYSNGFTRPAAMLDPIRALPGWVSRGTGGVEHAKPFWTYLEWLARMEPLLLVLGGVGVALAFVTRRPFDRFVAAWTIGTLLFFSVLSYKTPWLVVDLVLPLAVAAGITVREAWRRAAAWRLAAPRPADEGAVPVRSARGAVLAGLALAAGVGAADAFDAAVVRYDDHATVYPYAQTFRGYRGLLEAIDEATRGRDPKSVRIAVTAPEYWPLPWDLRRFTQVGYFGGLQPNLDHDLVIASAGQEPQFVEPNAYERLPFPLRPGVDLVLYRRRR